jgi:hypothetical protein
MNSFNLIFATVIEKGHDYIQTDYKWTAAIKMTAII